MDPSFAEPLIDKNKGNDAAPNVYIMLAPRTNLGKLACLGICGKDGLTPIPSSTIFSPLSLPQNSTGTSFTPGYSIR